MKAIQVSFLMLVTINSTTLASANKEDIIKLRDFSLEELMNVEVAVASKTKEKSLQETPGMSL